MRLLYKNQDDTSGAMKLPENLREILCRDLELDKLAKALSFDAKFPITTEMIFDLMTSNAEDIKRRQEISGDLFDNKELYSDLNNIYKKMTGLLDIANDKTNISNKGIENHAIIIKWIDHYCTVILELAGLLEKHKKVITASAFNELRDIVTTIKMTEEFNTILYNIKKMKSESRQTKSVKLGINLDDYLEPASVNCIEANDFYYYPRKVVDINVGGNNRIHGIGKFKYVPKGERTVRNQRYDEKTAPVVLVHASKLQRLVACEVDIGFIQSLNSFFKTLNFNNRTAVRNFIAEKVTEISELINDIGFFLGGIKMINQMSDYGMPVCLANIGISSKKVYDVKELYNCYLPFILKNPSDDIICSDFYLGDNMVFGILNGPNKGGKTTFIQAVALSVILFQLGFHTPCKDATITPVDMILTHYQREETGDRTGRLETEAESIRLMFSSITENSLILLNEPYVSTSPSEGMFLIMNSLKGIQALACRGILVTHYHKLNDIIETSNDASESKIGFFNMGIDVSGNDRRRTYELKRGRGKIKSYAMDILQEYAPGLIKRSM